MESRLDFLEGRVEEQSRNWERLFGEISRLDQKVDLRVDALSTRIDTVRLELDRKLDSKIDSLSDKIDRHFMWLVGIQIAALAAIIGALVRR
jgi:hypothetical protein